MNRQTFEHIADGKDVLCLVVAVTVLTAHSFSQSVDPISHTAHRRVLVSIPDRKLVVLENDEVIARFPVSVGAPVSPSPEGEFEIVNRVANPTYYHAGTVIPAGKDNPVGTRWIGLNEKGYGIHGTNVPSSIGHAASHGCIRLRNRDMEKLFSMLRVGDRVEIRGDRDEEMAEIFGAEVTVASNEAVPEPWQESAVNSCGLVGASGFS